MADTSKDFVGPVTCEHASKARQPGLCKACNELKPYMVFRFGKNGGYFWGPGYPIESERGKRPYWSTGDDEG